MNYHHVFWKIEKLSDGQLLERLSSVLGSSRRLMAELLAHLGEVEERRLHLLAACSSMFAYCVKLGMTEDEAYRRIEAARLARRYPAIFPLLADGQLTISAVALLKHYLSDENHLELLGAIAGKSVAQTRELIASRFPRPDVASSVRKLPERRAVSQPSLAMSGATAPLGRETLPSTGETLPRTGATLPRTGPTQPPHAQSAARIEPLSAERYRVQFTASAELARKLELARDLTRHARPGGEIGPIVERALDLLIESLMQRRFGKKASAQRTSGRAGRTDGERRLDVMDDGAEIGGTARPATSMHGTAEPDTPTPLGTVEAAATARAVAEPDVAEPGTPTPLDTAELQGDLPSPLTRAHVSSYIPRSARRTVVERDGLGCSWVDESGVRCGSHAWLEYDHRRPRAKGGDSKPDNLRLLCRSHNRLAAERELGREHVERAIAERSRHRAPHAI